MESSCNIEVKVIYAKDLKGFNFFQKLNVYALVSIVSDDPNKKVEQNQQQRTPADKEGDGNPEWNYEMHFDSNEASFRDCDHLFIQFDMRHEGVMFGDKTIGEVRVPFKDLIQECNGIVRFVSYEVRSPDGKPNGMLNFSYKVNAKGNEIGTNSPAEVTGYPVVHHHHHHQSHEDQYPSSEIQSISQEIHYPSLELQDTTQETFSAPQEVHNSSPGAQYSSQESYYPPPDTYYPPPPPPPPPPFPHPLLPPPPPPMAHGAYYRPPHAPWGPNPYGYDMHRTQGHAPGRLHNFDNGEMWPNGFLAGGDRHSSSWNGR